MKTNSNQGMFKPLEKKRYSELVAEMIQDRILKDRLEIGTLLPSEKGLAEEFKVSRSVIREALRILEISGLVEIKKGPGGGIFVTDGYGEPIKKSLGIMISSGDVTIDHLFDVRMLMEPYIAGQAACHATEKDLKILEDLILESSNHPDDAAVLKRNNLNFHLMLAEASGNPILSTLLESLLRLLVEISMDFLDLKLERHFYKAHKEIFQAIQQKQEQKAIKLMQKDILDVKQKLKSFKKRKRTKK